MPCGAGGCRRDRKGRTFSQRRIGRTSPLAIIDGARLSPGVVPNAGSNTDWLRAGRAHGHGPSWFSSRFLRRPARSRTGDAADDGAERSSDDRPRNGSGHRTGGRSFLSLRGRGQQHHRQRDQCKTGSHRGLISHGSRSPLSLGGKHGVVKAGGRLTVARHLVSQPPRALCRDRCWRIDGAVAQTPPRRASLGPPFVCSGSERHVEEAEGTGGAERERHVGRALFGVTGGPDGGHQRLHRL